MFTIFNHNIKRDIKTLDLPEHTTASLEQETTKLAAMSIPNELYGNVGLRVKEIVRNSYLASFNIIMYIIAGLALLSSIVAYMTIGPKTKKGNTT